MRLRQLINHRHLSNPISLFCLALFILLAFSSQVGADLADTNGQFSLDERVMVPIDPEGPACCLSGSCCLKKTSSPIHALDAAESSSSSTLTTNQPRMNGKSSFNLQSLESLGSHPASNASASPNQPLQKKVNSGTSTDALNTSSVCKKINLAPPAKVKTAAKTHMQSEDYTKCKNAAKQLLEFRFVNGKYQNKPEIVAPTLGKQKKYKNLLENYVNSCLSHPTDQKTTDALGKAQIKKILSMTGYFHGSNPKSPTCTGTLLGKNILTARHCFWRKSTSNPSGEVVVQKIDKFSLFSDPITKYSFHINKKAHPNKITFSINNIDKDWIILGLDQSPSQKRSINVKSPEQWDNLIFSGLNTQSIFLQKLDRKINPASTTESPIMPYLDLSPICIAGMIDGSFLFHSCQTESGTSGAPIFRLEKNKSLEIVGIQSGPSFISANECTKKGTKYFKNYGVSLPPNIQLLLSKENN